MLILPRIVASLTGLGVAFLVKGSLTLVVGLGIAVLLRRRHAALRHAVLTATLIGALIVPLLGRALPPLWATIPASRIPSVSVGSEASVSQPAGSTRGTASPSERQREPGVRVGTLAPRLAPPQQPSRIGELALPLLAGIWVCGLVVVLARVLVGWMSTRRLIRGARRAGADWETLTRQLAVRLSVRRRVEVREHHSLSIPVAAGAFHPVIVLPAGAESWSAERRQLVVAHELAHVRRYDCLIEYLAAFACGVYWFHPLAWRLAARLRVERERSCDDVVLQLGTTAPDYAEHLVELAAAARRTRWPLGAALAMAPVGSLESRVNDILEPTRRRDGMTWLTRGAVLGGAAFVIVPLSAVQPRLSGRGADGVALFSQSRARDTTDIVIGANETVRWTGVVATGATISVRANMGDISVDTSESGELEVIAERRAGPYAQPADTRLSIIRGDAGAIVCSAYMDVDRGRSRCEADGDWGRTSVRDNTVSLRVRVPAGVHLRIQAGLGDVRATGIRGDVHILDGNGNANVSSGGAADVTTYTGALAFTRLAGGRGGPIALRVLHGTIRARVAGGADIDAVADSGVVHVSAPSLPGVVSGPRYRGALLGGRAPFVARIQKGDVEVSITP